MLPVEWAGIPYLTIVGYAVMLVKRQKPHSLLRLLPGALRMRMKADGLSQSALSKRLSIPQPQISRALAAKRKRLTPSMEKLCQYAGLISSKHSLAERHDKLSALLRELVGDSAPAARLVEGVMLSLVPIAEKLRAENE